jgi:hypothetical protein
MERRRPPPQACAVRANGSFANARFHACVLGALAEFLYYSSWISRRERRDALARQTESRPTFGEIARRLGLVRSQRMDAVVASMAKGERIGDRAVAMGVLSVASRDHVLRVQRQMQRPIGRYFVEARLMDVREVRQRVRRQRQHNEQACGSWPIR